MKPRNKVILLSLCMMMSLVSCGQETETSSLSVPTSSVSASEEMEEKDTYYFDSKAKNEGNGTKASPYSSLAKLSSLALNPGSKILLKKGSFFNETLHLVSLQGTEDSPISVTSYGTGDKPILAGTCETDKGVLYIEDCSYVTVSDIEIEDIDSSEKDIRGVCVNLTGSDTETVTYHDITLENLYIHDIKGITDADNNGMSKASKFTGGIVVYSSDMKGRVDGLNIQNNVISNVDNVGIATFLNPNWKVSPYDETFKDTAYLNVLIDSNNISNVGKNGIFVRNLYGGKISHNVVHDTAVRCYTGNQIVTSYVDGTVIEFNEGYNNKAMANPNGEKEICDGSMLDADLQSRNTIWQYNYSHNNAFGLFMNCSASEPTDKGAEDNIVVRFNLSVADEGKMGIIYANYYVGSIECYNNTIVVSSSVENPIVLQVKDDRAMHLYNNLFCYEDNINAKFEVYNHSKLNMEYNWFYPESNLDDVKEISMNSIYNSDPLLNGFVSSQDTKISGLNTGADIAKPSNPDLFKTENCKTLEGVEKDFAGNDCVPCIGCICK